MDAEFPRWRTQARKGVLELAILNVMAGDQVYGYQVAKRLGEVFGPDLSEGTVYPILSRLRRQGLVRATTVDSPDGPPRKYYALTAAGRRQLEQMNQDWERLCQSIRSLRRSARP